MVVDRRRIHLLNSREETAGPVVYWMGRDQRAEDNWALLHAQELALERRAPLAVLVTLAPSFTGPTLRQYGFMLKGLAETALRLERLGIPLFLLRGDPPESVAVFERRHGLSVVVTDFDPLRPKRFWRERAAAGARAAYVEVDAHNIVPCRLASPKREYGAHTLRPKIRRLLPEFLVDIPSPVPHPFSWPVPSPPFDVDRLLGEPDMDRAVAEVAWPKPGGAAGRSQLARFLERGLERYHLDRNDPTLPGQSGLSPWLHFGQLAPQRVALEAARRLSSLAGVEAFLEELVVRRELSDNFCLYNDAYDRVEGFPAWAAATLARHGGDPRPYLYEPEQLENGETHDPLWNAAQRSMVVEGKMHGYLRMYWAKKILEWSPTPREALETTIRLNDRYELDGSDPNGYAGIAWSLGGVHDRAWGERPLFGKVRYMSIAGCRRKFDVAAFVARWGDDRRGSSHARAGLLLP